DDCCRTTRYCSNAVLCRTIRQRSWADLSPNRSQRCFGSKNTSQFVEERILCVLRALLLDFFHLLNGPAACAWVKRTPGLDTAQARDVFVAQAQVGTFI